MLHNDSLYLQYDKTTQYLKEVKQKALNNPLLLDRDNIKYV